VSRQQPAVLPSRIVVCDAQAFSLLGEDEHHPDKRKLKIALKVLAGEGYAQAASVVTLVEQRRTGCAKQRLAFEESRFTLFEVTVDIARAAAKLLEDTGLDRHECVVDSIVVATAASVSGGARVLSSDGSHMPKLCKAAGVAFRHI
jgi:hypothetical protein